MANRIAIFLLCAVALLVGPAETAQADTTTQLPFTNDHGAWLAVDQAGGHVFVSGGPGTSGIVVLDYSGKIVKTINGESGASQMALNPATHTLYVALHDATAISEINTQTLTETKRFSTAPYPNPNNIVIAGGKLWFSCFQNDGEGCHGLITAKLDGSSMAPASAPVANYFFATDLTAGGPGNKYVAVGSSYGEPPDVDVYDVSGVTPTLVSHVHDPDGGSAQVRDLTFDPSGANLLLACGAPYYVESLATSTLLSSGEYPTGPYPIAVAVSANGKYVAGGIDTNQGNDVFVYPVGGTTPVRTWLVGNDNGASLADHGLAFSSDASRLFAVSQDAATGHLAFHVLDEPTVRLAVSSTSLTRSSKKKVRYGGHASLKVHVKGAGTGSGKIDLYATTSSGTKLAAARTLKSGSVSFKVKPRQKTTYAAELEQGSAYASSTSHGVSIAVAPAISIATHPAGTTRLRGQRVSRTRVTVTLRPLLPPESVGFVVQRHIGGRWRADISTRFSIESDGRVHAFFFTTRPGPCRIRVSYTGDPNFAPSKSAWKKFRAR